MPLQLAGRAAGLNPTAPVLRGVLRVVFLDVALGIAVLAFLIYRQLVPRPVNASALRLIAILVVIGLLQSYQFLSKHTAHPLTLGAVFGSLVLAAVFGALRASTVGIWIQDGEPWSKGNVLTAVLWIASLTAHLVYDFMLVHGPDARGLGTATLILYLAVTLGVQRGIVLQRAQRLGGPGGLRQIGRPG